MQMVSLAFALICFVCRLIVPTLRIALQEISGNCTHTKLYHHRQLVHLQAPADSLYYPNNHRVAVGSLLSPLWGAA